MNSQVGHTQQPDYDMYANLATQEGKGVMERPGRPLANYVYGPIGYLPQSRTSPGDWHVSDEQVRICLEAPRKGDRIIVTEKLDGTCVSVANINGEIVALTGTGYNAADSAFGHLHAFALWVKESQDIFARLLSPSEWIAGEWLALAHGMIYDWEHPDFANFIAFDLFKEKNRVLRDEFRVRLEATDLISATCIHDSADPLSVEAAMIRLGKHGYHGALDGVEGAVWRVECEGRVDFLAKYVHDRQGR